MKAIIRILILLMTAMVAFGANGGSVSGTVTSADGKPLRAAFVRIQNLQTRMNMHVLSNSQGRYHADDVPPGKYRVFVSTLGYNGDVKDGVEIKADSSLSIDLTAQKRPLRWDEISESQGRVLLPEGPGKAYLVGPCAQCHAFQHFIAGTHRTEDAWRNEVAFMRNPIDGMGWFLSPRMMDDRAADILVSYLTKNFGPDSKLPNPEDLPDYEKVRRPEPSDEALNIVYVDYEMPGRNRMPFSAAPDGRGNAWIPEYGVVNRIARLDVNTGSIEEIRIPTACGKDCSIPGTTTALIHSAVAAPDGIVWFSEQGTNRIGKYNPVTKEVKEYQQPNSAPNMYKHTIRVGHDGKIWASGNPLSRFDPKTETFTEVPGVGNTYAIELDHDGNIWYTVMAADGVLGKVDAETLKVTKYKPPTMDARPRRVASAPDGSMWICEWGTGMLARFDPKTETFREYKVPPGAPAIGPGPYPINFDKEGNVWYGAEFSDSIIKLDPKTGQTVDYPSPYAENYSKEFFLDDQERMWYGTVANNRAGYFKIVPSSQRRAAR